MKILRQKEYSKFSHALKHIGRGAAIGAGLGYLAGSIESARKSKNIFPSYDYKPALIGMGIGALLGGAIGYKGHETDWELFHKAEEYERTHKAEVAEALEQVDIQDSILKRIERYDNNDTYIRLNMIDFIRTELENRGYGDYVIEFFEIGNLLKSGFPRVSATKPKEIKNLVALSLSKKQTYLPLISCAFTGFNEARTLTSNTLVYDWSSKKFGIIDKTWKLISSFNSFDSAKNMCIKYLRGFKTTPTNAINKNEYDQLIDEMDIELYADDFPSYEEVCKVMSGIINKAIDEYIKEINKI